MLFAKSCLFSLRTLIILQNKKFPIKYQEILKEGLKLDLGEFKPLVKAAYLARIKDKLFKKDLYQNIKFLNQFILPQIKAKLSKKILFNLSF